MGLDSRPIGVRLNCVSFRTQRFFANTIALLRFKQDEVKPRRKQMELFLQGLFRKRRSSVGNSKRNHGLSRRAAMVVDRRTSDSGRRFSSRRYPVAGLEGAQAFETGTSSGPRVGIHNAAVFSQAKS